MSLDSFDSILDATLDDLADMPSISLFPNGAHKVKLEFTVNREKKSIQVQMTYVEALELADPLAVAPVAGDKNSIFLNLMNKDGKPNEYAQGTLKMIMAALAPTFPGNNMEIMTAAKDAEVAVVTKIRIGKGEYVGRDNIEITKVELI